MQHRQLAERALRKKEGVNRKRRKGKERKCMGTKSKGKRKRGDKKRKKSRKEKGGEKGKGKERKEKNCKGGFKEERKNGRREKLTKKGKEVPELSTHYTVASRARVSHTIIKSEPECGFVRSAKEVLERA